MTSQEIWAIFNDEYLPATDAGHKWGQYELLRTQTSSNLSGSVKLHADLRVGDDEISVEASGNGPVDAFLQVLAGRGLVCPDGEEPQVIQAGDSVWVPPGERHWHGAAPDSFMSHTAISLGETRWAEEVTDA